MATIIPINKKVNSERMLKTGEFQTEYFHNDEMTWLISYLRNVKKLDKKDIFVKWVPFYLKNENVIPEYASDQFKSFWASSYKYIMKDKNPEIVMWQEEIDYINSLPIAQWIRQYMFILILHVRTTGNELYDYLPLGDYRKFLSTTNKNPSEMKDTLMKVLRQYDFVKDVEIEEHHDILETFDEYGNPCDVEYDVVIKNNRLQIKSPICKYGGEIGYRYKTILDGLKDLQEIKDTCICSECGKEFVFYNKTQTYICDECWNKKEKERLKQKNNTIKEFTKICSCCGKEFVANGKTKRSVCDECWKEKERERIRLAVAKRRKNKM